MKHRSLSLSLALLLWVGLANVAPAADRPVNPASGFIAAADAGVLTSSSATPTLSVARPQTAGWHVLLADYRVESAADTQSELRVEATAVDGAQRLSRSETFASRPDWTPLRLHIRLDQPDAFNVRFSQLPHGASLHLCNVTVRRYAASPEENLLINGSLAAGSPGDLPVGWKRAPYSGGPAAHTQLVADTSFRTGEQVLRLTHDGEGPPRIIESTFMPLPTSGRLTLSFWARSASPTAVLDGWLFGDNWTWQYQVSNTFSLSPTWKKFTVSGPCPGEIKKDPYFFARFDLNHPAQVDIADISVTWSEQKPADNPGWIGAPGKNLLLNPDFELGWTGWYVDHFSDWSEKRDTRVAMGHGRESGPVSGAGIDGGTAFRLGFGSALVSYAVPIEVGQTYTISADFKALDPSAEATVYFISTDWNLRQTGLRDFRTDRWERRTFTFTWDTPLLHPRGYVRIDSDKLLVDRVQLEKGQPSAFTPPPVMLGANAGEKNYFVRGRSSPRLTINAHPSSAVSEPYTISAVIKDAWSRTVWENTFRAPHDRAWDETITPRADLLGTFEVDLTATGADGKLLGVGTARYAVIEPPPANAPAATLFGMHHETAVVPSWFTEKHGDLFTDLGVGWNRFFFREGDLQRHPDPAWVETVRAQLAPLNRRNIRQIGCVDFYPAELAQRVIHVETPDPEALEAYGEHIGNLVSALQHDLRYWEILNEPNLWRHGPGPLHGKLSVPPEKYVAILKVAHAAIKRVDPALQVVGGCVNGTDWPWLKRVLELGGGRYMDLFSFHSYRSSPDAPGADTYPDLLKYRALLDEHGFTGPMINSEQYFAADLYHWRGNPDEVRRGYYVPGREERRAAARTIRNYIHHAAAGVPYCAFSPEITVATYGGGQPFFLHHLFSAYSAANRLLAGAGRGELLPTGTSMRVFLFPDAADGPLVTLNTPSPETEGRMRLQGDFTAYDFNGNPFSAAEVAQGLPLRVDPVYVRFPPATPPDRIRDALLHADVLGLGDPFQARVALSAADELSVFVTNRSHRSHDGDVHIETLPAGWAVKSPTRPFDALAPGETRRVAFRIEGAAAHNMQVYATGVIVRSGDNFLRQPAQLRPVFAHRLRRPKIDGELSDWRGAHWIALGDDHVSAAFTPGLRRSGPDDLSARVAFAWSDTHFLIAAEVGDDHFAAAGTAERGWQGDSVQVYFDQRGDGATQLNGYGPDDIVYTLALIDGTATAHLDRAGSERYVGKSNLSQGVDRAVDVAIIRRGTRTIYEARFPKAVLPETLLHAGSSFGLSLLINDNDGDGRKTGLTLSPRGTEPHERPANWRSVLLAP